MRTLRPLLLFVLAFAAPARADDRPVEVAIDQSIESLLKKEGVTAAPQADDATLIRRLTLDLVGRIPTVAESDEYVKSTDPAKRGKLVDRLMASPAFVRHQANQFDAMLAGPDGRRGSAVREYLQTALKDGKTWDAIFRELMLPNDGDPKQKGATEYLRARVVDLDRLANDVSVAFFGVNVSCAQCHNHPLVEDWKQDHFYGMKSFFARTYESGGTVGEREAGLVKFKPTKGPERSAKLMFLTGAVAETDTLRELTKDEQKKEKEAADKAKGTKKGQISAPPPPKFSARAELVKLALKPGGEPFFAKSIANRLWHRFLGYGLVNPLDQMHSENAPSHPELLAWLAEDTARHGYDLRRLTRGIVMSQTYSRTSALPAETHPHAKFFAVGRLKPLTPQQLATSLKLATTDQTGFEKLKPEELEKKLESLESSARGLASSIAPPTDDFQIGVGEALLFSNSDKVAKEFLSDANGTLLGRVKSMKDPREALTLMTKAVFGRAPGDDELSAYVAYVQKRNDRPAEAYKQVLWAMLTSAECRFCY